MGGLLVLRGVENFAFIFGRTTGVPGLKVVLKLLVQLCTQSLSSVCEQTQGKPLPALTSQRSRAGRDLKRHLLQFYTFF